MYNPILTPVQSAQKSWRLVFDQQSFWAPFF